MLAVDFFLALKSGWERESDKERERREKKYKIIIYKAIVTVHICKVTIEILQISNVLDRLVWVVSKKKCVKLCKFCKFLYFVLAGASTLRG